MLMSGYRGHVIGAIAVNTVVVATVFALPVSIDAVPHKILSNWQLITGLYVFAVLFGLFPDVDTNSMGQNIFYGVAFVADVMLIVTGRYEAGAYLGLIAMAPVLSKHRGWTHTLIAMVLIPLPILIVPYFHNHLIIYSSILLYISAVSGYFSHLLLDGLVIKKFRRHS
ncbi:MAG: metal-dependent hydrolase [Candidatus Saccharimonadales bacterium]